MAVKWLYSKFIRILATLSVTTPVFSHVVNIIGKRLSSELDLNKMFRCMTVKLHICLGSFVFCMWYLLHDSKLNVHNF